MPHTELVHFMTPDEYLAFEQQAEVKHEYVNGLIIAMAGASRRHNLLTLSMAALLRSHLRGTPGQTYANAMKINASHKGNQVFYYPDIMVACHGQDRDCDPFVEEQPQIVVEVLSPSTQMRDRMEKLAAYTAIAGLREYVLVAQDTLEIDVYQSTGAQWEIVRYRDDPDATLSLNSIGFSTRMKDIYEDIPELVNV